VSTQRRRPREVEEVIGDCATELARHVRIRREWPSLVAKPEIRTVATCQRFQIDLEAGRARARNHQQTRDFDLLKMAGDVRFGMATCAACPLRTQCTRGQGGRTVHVHPREICSNST